LNNIGTEGQTEGKLTRKRGEGQLVRRSQGYIERRRGIKNDPQETLYAGRVRTRKRLKRGSKTADNLRRTGELTQKKDSLAIRQGVARLKGKERRKRYFANQEKGS